MSYDIRVLEPADWDRWFSTLELAFGGIAETAEVRELDRAVTEYARSIGVWDGDRVIGTAGAFSFQLTVPGGSLVPTAGVTMVGVSPVHRRRGVLTAMMRRQLDDVRALGEPLAVLTASEPAIYGRFGYGVASQKLSAEVETARVALSVPPGTDDVRLRLAAPADVLDECEALYARLVPGRPGMIARLPGWERRMVADPAEDREGASPLQCVVAERAGETVGFARYRIKPVWRPGSVPEGEVRLDDLEALDPAAYAALWRFLFGIDLTSRIVAGDRPVDDAFQHLVSDARRCGLRLRDGLYLRPVEVGAALEARTYAAEVDVVLAVEDTFCPWNTGRWRLSGDAKGASCERTTDPAELALSVREIGSAYLGGCSLDSLAAAGRVRELREGALVRASAAFASVRAPWLPHGF
ncbi:GNAT family N-acetyltransferase [Streptomyces triticagri]|uniref:GNAT family N-acetyltransferase n=1 Tax=Streptomyces triticagri TaxID=2293568 RepID=A0A372M3I6_9ACTN|nr:GNAT family N-acetyltransferase [Streptomyces triticagri]RFU84867.1 GNAT family N-acetyltransferase [Streptomyces triticagri]